MQRIPSLDGLRALSIGLVVVGHSIPTNQWDWLLWKIVGNGDLGVSIFFVISGFLITSLILKEHHETGEISLKRFYLRRAFRMLPPFYFFLLIAVLLKMLGDIDFGLRSLASALLFVRDYWRAPDRWLAHTWSPSIEEQFYLLWPVCLAVVGIAKSRNVAITLIVAAPVVRVLCHVLLPQVGWREQLMFDMRVDGLMIGCAIAMFHDKLRFNWTWPAPVALFLFALSPYLIARLHGYYLLPLGYSLDNFAIAYLLLYAVRNPQSRVGRVLNNRIVAHLGVISCSLYLWQQVFLGKLAFPWSVLGAIVGAELSWRIVERPALRLRDRVMEHHVLVTAT